MLVGPGQESCNETWVNTFWECTGHTASFSLRVSQVSDTRAKSPESRCWCLSSPPGRPAYSPACSRAWEILYLLFAQQGQHHPAMQREPKYLWKLGWDGIQIWLLTAKGQVERGLAYKTEPGPFPSARPNWLLLSKTMRALKIRFKLAGSPFLLSCPSYPLLGLSSNTPILLKLSKPEFPFITIF